MSSKNSIQALLFGCLLLAGCRKEELPVKPLDRGAVITSSVNLGADYRQQVFFSLADNKAVASNLKTSWDLAFECAANGYHIRLNSAKAMSAAIALQNDFALVTDTAGFSQRRRYDAPSGNLDSTSFGNWQTGNPVYLVDRGFNQAGTPLGFRKIQVLSVSPAGYSIKVAELNGSNEMTVTISKNALKNFAFLSFGSNSVVNVEPDKSTYDLLFSQYTHVYSNTGSIYLVTGVLFNPAYVKVAEISDKDFVAIALADTITHPFTYAQDAIGYDWKTYNYQTATYVIDPGRSFIIRDVQGFYYKLHFIDFYGPDGQKGQPGFEFKKL